LTPTDRPGCASAHSILYLRLREEPHLVRALFDINKAGLVIVGIFVLIWGVSFRLWPIVVARRASPGAGLVMAPTVSRHSATTRMPRSSPIR
jgi:hypothetical protein